MKEYRVAFRREALLQLEELYDYIADTGSPHNATRYTESIVGFCEETWHLSPPRCRTRRHPTGPADDRLRKTCHRRVCHLDDTVAILGVFYGGRDYESILTTSESSPE